MKRTITFYEFRDGFKQIRPDNFSLDGLISLFEHLEQYEDDVDEEIEFDVIAICCDYTEYEDLKEFQSNYGNEYKSIDDIEAETIVVPIENSESFIIQDF